MKGGLLKVAALAGWMGSVGGGHRRGKSGRGQFLDKNLPLRTPAAQGPAQGPRKAQGANGSQGALSGCWLACWLSGPPVQGARAMTRA